MKFIYALMMFCLLSHIPARATAQTACMQTFSAIRNTVGQIKLKATRKAESQIRDLRYEEFGPNVRFSEMFPISPSIGFPLITFITTSLPAIYFEWDAFIASAFIIPATFTAIPLGMLAQLKWQPDIKQIIAKKAYLDVLENLGLSKKELTEVQNSNALGRIHLLPEFTEEFLLSYEEFLLHYFVEQINNLHQVKDFLNKQQKDFMESLAEEVSNFVESQQNRITGGQRSHTRSNSKKDDSLSTSKKKFEETAQQIMSQLQKSGMSKEEAIIFIIEQIRSHSYIIRSYVQFVSEKVGFTKEETQTFAQIIESHLNSEKPEDLAGMELAVN